MAEMVAGTPSVRVVHPVLITSILALYAMVRIIEILPFTTPSTPIVAIEILSALTFAVVHGAHRLGLRSILVFAAMCLAIGGATEVIGVRTGFPFGPYQFLPLMGSQLLQVPILLGLAYIGMAYASWTVALSIGAPRQQSSSPWPSLRVSLLAGVAMTAWDLAQDPVWSTLLHAW